LEPALRAAILGEPDLLIGIYAAIRGEPGLYCGQYAAVQTDNALSYYCYAAIARNFDMRCKMLARVVCMYELLFSAKAAIRSQRELATGIRARVARRYT
jgi:hypothetical protein